VPVTDDLATLRVSDLDLGRYVTVDPTESVARAIQAMRESGFSCACVVDDGRLVGVFTQRDVLMRVLGRPRVCGRPIAEEMTRSPRTMTADQSVADGLALMTEWWIRSVPVLDDDDRLLGTLSWYTVMSLMAGLLERTRSQEESEPGPGHGLAFVDFTGLNTSTPVIVAETDTVDVAVHHMRSRAIGSVLVVDGREQLTGILTEFDLLVKLGCTVDDLSSVEVREAMSSEVVAVSARSPIADAIHAMADRGFSHAPILGESSRPVGVASFRDLATYFETSLESMV
jgi:CBS domain-containing protein